MLALRLPLRPQQLGNIFGPTANLAQEADMLKKTEFAVVSYLPKTIDFYQSLGRVASARNAC
jgi:hypothetical protein